MLDAVGSFKDVCAHEGLFASGGELSALEIFLGERVGVSSCADPFGSVSILAWIEVCIERKEQRKDTKFTYRYEGCWQEEQGHYGDDFY